MPFIVIHLDVTGDRLDEDPHEVAQEIIDHAVDQGRRYADERKVIFVDAEWED